MSGSCPGSLVCAADSVCRAACDNGKSCPDGLFCHQGACYAEPPDAGPPDAQNPSICGDEEVTGDEVCDDGVNDGSYGGCMPGCLVRAPRCGDNSINGGETCDGTALYGQSCLSRGLAFGGGELKCSADCDAFDITGCHFLLKHILLAENSTRGEVYTLDVNGAGKALVFSLPQGESIRQAPRLSPDGTRILYSNSTTRQFLYYDLLTKKHEHITDWEPSEFGGGPMGWLSEDEIFMRWALEKGKNELRRVGLDGGTPAPWVDGNIVGRGDVRMADVSPDRQRVAFVAAKFNWAPYQDVYAVDIDGVSNPKTIQQDTDLEEEEPLTVDDPWIAWLPDSKTLVGVRARGLNLGVYPADLVQYDVDTGAMSVVKESYSDAHSSSTVEVLDAENVVVSAFLEDNLDLYRIHLPTGQMVRITTATPQFAGFSAIIPPCGNGVVQPEIGEECDDGAENSDTLPDACRTTCHEAKCGDGVVDTGELLECWTHSAGSPYAIPANHSPVAVGDVTGDGLLDVVTGFGTEAWIMRGDGLGGLTHKTTISGGGAFPVLATIDGDNHLDLVMAAGPTSKIRILLGDGNGSFAEQAGSPITLMSGINAIPVVRDVTGDGHADVVVVAYNTSNAGKLFLLRGDGNGSFIQETIADLGSLPMHADVGDVNNDGHLDIAVAHGYDTGDGLWIFLGDGSGGFTVSPQSPFLAGASFAHVLFGAHLAHVNGDANLDVITPCAYRGEIHVLMGDGAGGFSEAATSPITIAQPRRIAVGDLDNDGDVDVVAPSSASDGIFVYLGDGDGNFAATTDSPWLVTHYPLAPALADLDGNGFQDLVLTSDGVLNVVLNRP